jgi:uncharacterized membrane protein YqhA
MTKVNFGGLKQKLLASIVAISAIQVLKAFMNIDTVFDTQKLVSGLRPASGCYPHGEERGFARLEP